MAIKLYDLPNKITVVHPSESLYSVSNLPSGTATINITRLANCKVVFTLRDQDRKPIDLSIRHVAIISIVDGQTHQGLLERVLVPDLSKKGIATLTLSPQDTVMWRLGTHKFSVCFIDAYGNKDMVYTNENRGVVGELTLSSGAFAEEIPTTEITIFPPEIPPTGGTWYVSSPVHGSSMSTYLHTNHTFAVYCTGFTGVMYMQGAITNDQPSAEDWFSIDLDPGVETGFMFDDFTGVEPFSIDACLRWVRFIYQGASGKIDKILYRV